MGAVPMTSDGSTTSPPSRSDESGKDHHYYDAADGAGPATSPLPIDADEASTLRAAYRRIDWAIVPLMFLCYFLQFLDKVVVNYGNIMGLSVDLGFGPNDFQWMATAFFIGFAVAEAPQGLLIQRYPVNLVLGWNVVLWGVVVGCSAAAQNFVQMTALRTLLGVLEAVIMPALIMITAQWYTRRQATPRTGIWYSGLGAGQFLGGLISWAAQHGSATASFGSWRIMFVAVGVFNLMVGLAVVMWMPSGIPDAQRRGLLSAEQVAAVEAALARDRAGAQDRKVFRARGIWESLADAQVWLLCLNTVLIVIPSGIITTFSATLIRGFGYNPREAALLNMPSGVVSLVSTLLGTLFIQYRFPRWLSILVLLTPTMIGAGLMSFCDDNQAAALAGIYLINFIVAPLALIYAMVGANTRGYTKRITTSAAVAVAFSAANIIGPQTFQDRDAPQYLPAKITVFAVCGGSMVVTVATRLLYGARNRRTEAARRALEEQQQLQGSEVSADMGHGQGDITDREDPVFKYVY